VTDRSTGGANPARISAEPVVTRTGAGFIKAFTAWFLLVNCSLGSAEEVCSLFVDASSGTVLQRVGDCSFRASPASTFKVPLAIAGFDSGFLQSGRFPQLLFREGDPDWGGATWREPTDPQKWMRHSVVWYSQRITEYLGAERLLLYATRFAYGNLDFTGDPGQNNGLQWSWIGSSLRISPDEQVAFLRRLLSGNLPVKPDALEQTRSLLGYRFSGGWSIQGKTGTFSEVHQGKRTEYGWYVGWASRNERTVVFAYLTRDAAQAGRPAAGLRARDALLRDWERRVEALR
jgi:beta-lactamase class D